MPDVSLSRDGRTLTAHIPISLYRKPGRKLVIAPTGSSWAPKPARPDNTIVKALARAFRWRKLLETGVYGTIDEMANAEKINTSYVSRVLRLTLLAPPIVDSLVEGTHSDDLELNKMRTGFPIEWASQRMTLQTVPR